jgi:hypothetical protein
MMQIIYVSKDRKLQNKQRYKNCQKYKGSCLFPKTNVIRLTPQAKKQKKETKHMRYKNKVKKTY